MNFEKTITMDVIELKEAFEDICLFAYSNANLILLFILDRVTTRSMRTKTVKIEFINHWHALLQI